VRTQRFPLVATTRSANSEQQNPRTDRNNKTRDLCQALGEDSTSYTAPTSLPRLCDQAMEVMTHAAKVSGGEHAARDCRARVENLSSGNASPIRACRKEGAQLRGPIHVHLHENVLARLGVGASAVRRASSNQSLLSGVGTLRLSGGTPRAGRACAPKMPGMVKPARVDRSPAVAAVKDEPEEGEPLDWLALRLSCARAVRQGEIREQVGLERTSGSEAHAFEDHLYLAEPTRRTRMTRNNACLDLGALCKRACRIEETCE
ncbi:hypothetical protein T484DRAFT_3099885, partial [Baffinella frigidus]